MSLGRSRRRLGSRFDGADEDPRASLVNLVDVMLVFVCGLLAALTAGGQAVLRPVEVERGREIAPPDQGAGEAEADDHHGPGRGFRNRGDADAEVVDGDVALGAERGDAEAADAVGRVDTVADVIAVGEIEAVV